MRSVFADTSFYVALLSRQDALRECAVAFMTSYTGAVMTTEFVLLELGNFLSRSKRRSKLRPFIERLRGEAGTHVIPLSGHLFEHGLNLYASRGDKQWSLTDCISFVVMRDHGPTDALTGCVTETATFSTRAWACNCRVSARGAMAATTSALTTCRRKCHGPALSADHHFEQAGFNVLLK